MRASTTGYIVARLSHAMRLMTDPSVRSSDRPATEADMGIAFGDLEWGRGISEPSRGSCRQTYWAGA